MYLPYLSNGFRGNTNIALFDMKSNYFPGT